ncbi:Transmembrane protein [Melia azedarach]|uniref:Transmembrane protein n=1 Tax=Melia azedarach TaxID=155640 RepID=A0ACC1YRL7_MELAZ|nr:Transmembrane protein [Melia azedarach]
MTGEEMAGPAGPKMVRLFCFVGSGFICSIAINKWRELERQSLQKKQQDINLLTDDSDNALAFQLCKKKKWLAP